MHVADATLTNEEKKLVGEASADIRNKRKERFVSISEP